MRLFATLKLTLYPAVVRTPRFRGEAASSSTVDLFGKPCDVRAGIIRSIAEPIPVRTTRRADGHRAEYPHGRDPLGSGNRIKRGSSCADLALHFFCLWSSAFPAAAPW